MSSEFDPKVLSNYKDLIQRLNEVNGKPVVASTGGTSQNHQYTKDSETGRKGAIDVEYNNSGLTPETYKKMGEIALARGLRVGNEGDHLHIDDNEIEPDGKTVAPRIFTEKHGDEKITNHFKEFRNKLKESDTNYNYGNPETLMKIKKILKGK